MMKEFEFVEFICKVLVAKIQALLALVQIGICWTTLYSQDCYSNHFCPKRPLIVGASGLSNNDGQATIDRNISRDRPTDITHCQSLSSLHVLQHIEIFRHYFKSACVLHGHIKWLSGEWSPAYPSRSVVIYIHICRFTILSHQCPSAKADKVQFLAFNVNFVI